MYGEPHKSSPPALHLALTRSKASLLPQALVPTVLAANFMNGNNSAFNARVYLFNPSNNAGDITVRVFTLPLSGGLAQELTGGTPFNLGSLASKRAVNLKLAEDILTPLGITLPYTTDGGNLTLEFTIQAGDVRGTAQVFSPSFAFGTYPLQEIPSISQGSPTILSAEFMNGNNGAFNSRIYLWNPSNSAGDVTVRVFTLPLTGGLAQELTPTPLPFGNPGSQIGTQPSSWPRTSSPRWESRCLTQPTAATSLWSLRFKPPMFGERPRSSLPALPLAPIPSLKFPSKSGIRQLIR